MRNISDLLKRFTNSLNKDEIARQAVGEVVFSITHITVPPEQISLKDGILSIMASAAAKSEMRLKEEAILDALKGRYNIRVSRVIYK
jgi:hypothetical protein